MTEDWTPTEGRPDLDPEEAVRKALLFTLQMSDKEAARRLTALTGAAFIRALEQDGYTVAAPAAEPVPLTLDDIMEWLRRSDGRLEDIFGLWTQGKRDDRWVAEKLLAEGHLAALASPDKGEPAPARDPESPAPMFPCPLCGTTEEDLDGG